ncbi:MAG TPA: hypothetical protein VMZ28_12725 [Kofleriaceae bacterium]|nr:hypothetical protein [Kofleriaceae bacterium]
MNTSDKNVYGARTPDPDEPRTEQKTWPDTERDWPRDLPEADDQERIQAEAHGEDREEDEEAFDSGGLGPPVQGTRTQTGRGSTSGRS